LNRTVILASTPLHLFGAITLALSNRENLYNIILIDQKDTTYYLALKNWKNNPFKNIDITLTDKSSILRKIKSKRKAIKKILKVVEEINPKKLIVGNNRKTEVSAIIEKFKKKEVEYLDDGIHSYLLEKSSVLKYTLLDNIIRGLIYGYKIKTPKYIGCSSYIKKAYLFKPNLANSCIREKEIESLNIDILKSDKIKEFIYNLIDKDIEDILNSIETLLFLPHPKELNRDILNILIKKFDNKKVAIKTHPRDIYTSKLFKNAKIISKDIPTEALVLILPKDIKIIGFATTALLTAKWLNGNLDITSIEFNSRDSRLSQLMKESGIEIKRGDKI